MAPVPAVLGSARLANFRLAYMPADLAAIRRTSVRIILGGVDVTRRVLRRSLTIRDQLNDSPNSCALTLKDDPPPPDVADLRVSVGTDQPTLLFSGTLQTSANTFVGRPGNLLYPVTAIDDSARANRKRPFGKYTDVSATLVAKDVVARFAPGFTTYGVQAGLEPISVTFDGSEGFTGAMRAIAKLIGGYFYFLDLDLHLFTVESDPATLPDPIDYTHPFLYDPHIEVTRDFSQLRTRVYGRGLGAELLSDVAAAETFLPIQNSVSFNPAGGQAIVESQIVRYTGTQLGGAGSVVGPGAAPSTAPVVTGIAGSGIESGSHAWAVSFVTAAGESLPGPNAVRTSGVQGAPVAAPIISGPTMGTGPDPGAHDYAVTFLTGSGETVPGPRVSVATSVTPPPLTAVTPSAPLIGPGPDPGYHDWSVSFVTATGETPPGPISASVSTGLLAPPSGLGVPALASLGAGVDVGTHEYQATYATASGETLPSAPTPPVTANVFYPPGDIPVIAFSSYAHVNPPPHRLTTGATYRYGYTFATPYGETILSTVSANSVADANVGFNINVTYSNLGRPGQPAGIEFAHFYRSVNGGPFHRFQSWSGNYPSPVYDIYTGDADIAGNPTPPLVATALFAQVPIVLNPGPAGTTGKHVYRRFNGAGPFRRVTTLLNATTTYTDTTPNASLGASAPVVNTAHLQQFWLNFVPFGDDSVTARKLYRRSGGAGFRLVTTIPNRTDSAYLDNTPNASLGAAPPTINTAHLQRFSLAGIPLGTETVTGRRLYRTQANFSSLQLLATLAENTSTTFVDSFPDASLGALAPESNTATVSRVQLSSLPLGVAAVLSRKIYRTAAGLTQLKLVTTVADNTTTVYVDAASDTTLGANAPTADLSGLAQVVGQVLAGSTVLPLASGGAPFSPAGGWVQIGAQVVRYFGVSGNSLTGIPGPGLPGSLINTVRYGEHVNAAPVLMGVTGLTQPALHGVMVSIWVQRDDLDAQAAMIAIDAAQGRTSDGVYEYRISDERRGEASLIALCDADLQQFSRPILTVTYATRDLKTKSGKPVTFDLFSPSLHGTLTIQDVTITGIDQAPNLAPRFTVTASSVRYSLEDLLRQLAARVGV